MTRSKWDQRIERAQELAAIHPFAAEGLHFYERIASFQKSLYDGLAAESGGKKARARGSLRNELELLRLLPWFASFLGFVADVAPPPLAGSASGLHAAGTVRWEEVLDEFWRSGGLGTEPLAPLSDTESLLAWTFLQPYAESLADHTQRLEIHDTPPVCPLCSALPQVGILRPLGDGGKRSLLCSLCATEWEFRRIVCPACGEENVDKLPVYAAENLSYLRVEACDTCHCYITTVDLTKDGRAVPVVDELAAIPLSIWAAEKGYTKLSTNLLGI